MRGEIVFVVAVVLVLMGAWWAVADAQDVFKPSSPHERVDIPVEKPTRPTNWEEDDTGEDEGEADDEDEDEEPPVEIFDEEVEGDKVVYVMDKTGSMGWKVGHAITDENGNVINNPSKWQHIKAEFKKSVMGLSDNIKFSALLYSGNVVNFRGAQPPRVGWMGDAIISPPWITVLWNEVRKATPQRKAQAMAWIDGFNPYGGTPIHDAMHRALQIKGVETIILHTDGVNTIFNGHWWQEIYANLSWEVPAAGGKIINECKAAGVKVYTFGHCLANGYSQSIANLGKKMLQDIASATGGSFTEIN